MIDLLEYDGSNGQQIIEAMRLQPGDGIAMQPAGGRFEQAWILRAEQIEALRERGAIQDDEEA